MRENVEESTGPTHGTYEVSGIGVADDRTIGKGLLTALALKSDI